MHIPFNAASLKFSDNLLFDLAHGPFLVVKFFRQEGLLLADPSPDSVFIHKAVQKVFVPNRFAPAKTGDLGQDFGNLPGDFITPAVFAWNAGRIQGLR